MSTAREQNWIVRIILKDLKIGVSEKILLKFFHEDAGKHFCENGYGGGGGRWWW